MRLKIKTKKERVKPADKPKRNLRIKLPTSIRLGVIVILAFILIFCAFTIYAAYQKPTITQLSFVTFSYTQTGDFDHTVYLKSNSVYEKEYLKPEDNAIYFKNIVDHIDAEFTFTFQASDGSGTSLNLVISGSYKLVAEVQTDLWDKSEDIISNKQFNVTGKQVTFTETFTIAYEHYEDIIAQIDNETGVPATNPILYIKCYITLSGKAGDETIISSFTPSITVTLKQKTIVIREELANSMYREETEKEEVFHQEVVDERNTWTYASYISIAILAVFAIITAGKSKKLTKTEKKIKKIKKKFGDWMVESEKLPSKALVNIIPVKSIDDLMKTSEALRKPVVYYNSFKHEKHAFYVFDDTIWYEYVLQI